MFDFSKMLKNPRSALILGVVIGIAIMVVVGYYPQMFERFTQDSPSTEEVLKVPFYERLSATEDMDNPDIKRIVIKAAYIAAKDNHTMKAQLKRLMVKRINDSIDTDSAVKRLKKNYDRNIVETALKEARTAAENGAKMAVAEADLMVQTAVASVTPSPTPGPVVGVIASAPPQAPLPF
ncbi:MAG: hypothetical protein CMM25_01810 [Rhodospirillaceae bacterium]|nr:hypothetical protein [Rhodospirillaceae bacterium]